MCQRLQSPLGWAVSSHISLRLQGERDSCSSITCVKAASGRAEVGAEVLFFSLQELPSMGVLSADPLDLLTDLSVWLAASAWAWYRLSSLTRLWPPWGLGETQEPGVSNIRADHPLRGSFVGLSPKHCEIPMGVVQDTRPKNSITCGINNKM